MEAIRGAQVNGHRVVLCSGRNYGMLSPLLQYGFDGLVGSAGGYIEYGGEVVYDCPMTPEQQDRVLSVFEESGIYRTVESKDGSYTDEGFKDFLRESAGSGGNSELLRWREQLEQDLGIRPMAEYRGEPLYKLVFMCREAGQLRRPRQLLEAEFDFCLQDAGPSGILNGELINRKFDKGAAVRRLGGYLRIPLRDTVAFGDSMNDLQMIETGGAVGAMFGSFMGIGANAYGVTGIPGFLIVDSAKILPYAILLVISGAIAFALTWFVWKEDAPETKKEETPAAPAVPALTCAPGTVYAPVAGTVIPPPRRSPTRPLPPATRTWWCCW